jgi:Family of unknown function (DUF6308)
LFGWHEPSNARTPTVFRAGSRGEIADQAARPLHPPNTLVVEDLGVTLLMNSQVTWRNAVSVVERGSEIGLALLPERPLAETDERERQHVAELVASVASWRGFGASTATKLIHKKRPGLIPILDNLAIFGGI